MSKALKKTLDLFNLTRIDRDLYSWTGQSVGFQRIFGGQIMAVQRSLGAIQLALGKVTTAQKANAVATNTTSKSLKGFRLALIATVIGAIVIALGSLVAAFLSTQRGIDAVTSVLRPLQEVFQSFFQHHEKFFPRCLKKVLFHCRDNHCERH